MREVDKILLISTTKFKLRETKQWMLSPTFVNLYILTQAELPEMLKLFSHADDVSILSIDPHILKTAKISTVTTVTLKNGFKFANSNYQPKSSKLQTLFATLHGTKKYIGKHILGQDHETITTRL